MTVERPYIGREIPGEFQPPFEEMTTTSEEKLSQNLESQVNQLIDRYEGYNSLLPDHVKRDERDFEFARKFYRMVLAERNARATEVEAPRYREVIDLALDQIPTDTYLILCMDGRVLPPLAFGVSFGITDSFRRPAGNLQEFHRGTDGRKFLIPDSNFAHLIDLAFGRADVITEVFDSHIGCAARGAEESAAGVHPHDGGLCKDIAYKQEMADASRRFVAEKYGDKKTILPIQTTFDPHNGFMFMGLETEAAQSFAKEAAIGDGGAPEYTDEVIAQLVDEGKVISTERLSGELGDIFAQYDRFSMNWRNDYTGTAESFWLAISSMKHDALPIIEDQLKSIYPELADKSELAEIEIKERAMLLLMNTFSGHMLNKSEDGSSEQGGSYEFGFHKEQFIKIYEGGHTPYNTSAFVIFSLDEQTIPHDTEQAEELIRKNRREGRSKDPFGIYNTTQEFEQATIPVVIHEIVREPLSRAEWEALESIDWSDLSPNWDEMSGDEFKDYLMTKGIRNYAVIKGVDNLRKRMAVLYDSRNNLAHRFVRGELMALPTILDQSRRNHFVTPFVKLGY